MDPYLERPELWPDLRSRLIVLLAEELGPRLRPRYYVAIEERTYTVESGELLFAGRADAAVVEPVLKPAPSTRLRPHARSAAVTVELPLPDEIRETYLEVRSAADDRVVTVLEVLSPANKRPGEGREQYLRKRLRILGTRTHLVEINLLRAGENPTMWGYRQQADYYVLVSRAELRPQAELYPFTVRQPIPGFFLPLQTQDEEPVVELNQVLRTLYDRAGYDLRIDYRRDPDPPLPPEDTAWARGLLQTAGLR